MSKLANRLDAHFIACAAAATGMGAVATANAAIVDSGPVNIVIPDNLDGVYMDIVTGATGTGGFAGYDINPYSAVAGQFHLWGATTTTWMSIAGIFNLPAGTLIDATGAFSRPGGGTNIAPQVTLNSDQNFFGVQFINESNASLTHYGWVQIEFGATAGVRSIVRYAYEDVAGAGIGAGVIPAPGALALLAMGAAGVARRRRSA
ncbi:MAG: hypothetical protein KF768_11570 [Phycisphaeraceae bacterium]|nr:hypothetical protein [Phycisphaeraceae bacterium]